MVPPEVRNVNRADLEKVRRQDMPWSDGIAVLVLLRASLIDRHEEARLAHAAVVLDHGEHRVALSTDNLSGVPEEPTGELQFVSCANLGEGRRARQADVVLFANVGHAPIKCTDRAKTWLLILKDLRPASLEKSDSTATEVLASVETALEVIPAGDFAATLYIRAERSAVGT